MGDLRRAVALTPDDTCLAGLVADLVDASPEFAALWRAHPVRVCASQTRRLRHPVLGATTWGVEVLELPHDQGQRIITFVARSELRAREQLLSLAARPFS